MRFANGRIYTLDGVGSVVSCVSIGRNGRVAATGSNALPRIDGHDDEIDLRGRTVLPGMIDAHGHVRCLAEQSLSLDLQDAISPRDAAARIAERAAVIPPNAWIAGHGWDQTRWPGGAFPNYGQLDGAAPHNPVTLTRVDNHALWVNSAALAAAEIGDQTPDPPGGRIVRDSAGHATGVLLDAAGAMITRLLPAVDDERLRQAIADVAGQCAAYGLTGVHDMGVDQRTIAAYKALIDGGEMPLRVMAAVSAADDNAWNTWRANGPERRYGDRLSVSAVKLYADGALGSRGATLLEPYSDDRGNTGLTVTDTSTLERVTREATERGFQVCVHAIGDRANRSVLDVFERMLTSSPHADHRPRIEHAQVLDPQDVPRFSRLGVIASLQPIHRELDAPWVESRLGPRRSSLAYAWRPLLDDGASIAAGSDFPVASPNPMPGVAAAVNPRPFGGRPSPLISHAMTRREAVNAFTCGAAYAAFDEDVAGSLEPDKHGDLVVLERDIFRCPTEEIASIRVLMTVSGGKIVYQAPGEW